MSETPDPGGAPARAPVAACITAALPFMPYVVVIAALVAAGNGVDASAWQPLLLAGAVLIDPKSAARQGSPS